MRKRTKPVLFGPSAMRAVPARRRLGPSGGRKRAGRRGGNDGCDSADGPHGRSGTAMFPFILGWHLHAVMRPVMAEAEAEAETAAATEQADATPTAASAAPPEQKKKSGRAREGTTVRTIKVNFDQSAELSDLISRHMDQQRWAYNMAVREKLKDPRTTKFDLNNMLTK